MLCGSGSRTSKAERKQNKMEEKKNILTYAGLRKLEDELHDLKVNRRKEVAGQDQGGQRAGRLV